jgi:hypothetical protein
MKKLLSLAFLVLWCLPIFAEENPLCSDGECAPAISQVKYFGWDAYRLTDGRTDAIVVPAIGRVMSFGRVGEKSWLWSAMAVKGKASDWAGWRNWGGEKTWLSPQSRWNEFNGSGKKWPPPPQWDQQPFHAEVLSGGHLKLSGVVAPVTGTRIIREFWHEEDGDFAIRQTVEKLRGAPLIAGIWNVAQVDNTDLDAVFLPRSEKSDYPNGFVTLSENNPESFESVTPTLLRIGASSNGSYKIGTEAPISAAAALRNGWALVAVTSRPEGEYPDGQAGKSGTPVQLFGSGSPAPNNYVELELFSPLRRFVAGSSWTSTVRWRIEQMPSDTSDDPAVYAAIKKLFTR